MAYKPSTDDGPSTADLYRPAQAEGLLREAQPATGPEGGTGVSTLRATYTPCDGPHLGSELWRTPTR